MTSSMSNFVNKFIEGILKIKCKYWHDNKKRDTYVIKLKNCEWFLEYANCKNDSIKYKYLCCNNNYLKMFDEKFKKQIFNTYKFFKHDFNKFILLPWEEFYPYEYMDGCKNFNETVLLERLCKDFEIEDLEEYHDW